MTEITRVPLLPIAKGSLGKLWTGAIVTIAAGAALAWATATHYQQMTDGVMLATVKTGEGASPTEADTALVEVEGKLADGTVFQPKTRSPLDLQNTIPGFKQGVLHMQKGGEYKLTIPAKMGYGEAGGGAIPPGSDLYFNVKLIDFLSTEQVMQQQMMMRQIQQMQMQQQGQQGPRGQGVPQGAMPPEGAGPQ